MVAYISSRVNLPVIEIPSEVDVPVPFSLFSSKEAEILLPIKINLETSPSKAPFQSTYPSRENLLPRILYRDVRIFNIPEYSIDTLGYSLFTYKIISFLLVIENDYLPYNM